MALKDTDRQRLNTIVGKMKDANEDDSSIREMVSQFKTKFDVPDTVAAEPEKKGLMKTVLPRFSERLEKVQERKQAGDLPSEIGFKGKGIREIGKDVGEFFKEPLRGAAAGVSDVASIPGRTIASLPALAPGGETFGESFAKTRGEGIVGDIVRSPSTAASLTPQGALFKGAGLLPTLGKGAIEGFKSGIARQVEKVGEGEDVSGKEILGETAGGALGAGLIKGGGALLKRGTGFANKALGRLSEELSGVSEEALRKFGFGIGEGAKELKSAAGTQRKVGEKILNALDNFDDFLPEKPIVDEALENMPPVNISKTISALQEAMPLGRIGKQKQIPEQIGEVMQDLASSADDQGNIPAKAFRKLRIELDNEIGDAFAKDEGGALVNALKQGRFAMAHSLTDAAEQSGNPQYAEAMKSMANKMRIIDDLKGYVGKSDQARNRKIQGFIDNLFGKNKEDAQRVIGELSEVLGDDIIQESKLAQLAGQLGSKGTPGIAPMQATGRSGLGFGGAATQIGAGIATGQPGLVASGLGTAALTSPRVAAGTLAGLGGAQRGVEAAVDIGAPGARAALRGLTEEQIRELAKGRGK